MKHYHFGKLKEGEQLVRGVGRVKLLLDLLFFEVLACALGVRHFQRELDAAVLKTQLLLDKKWQELADRFQFLRTQLLSRRLKILLPVMRILTCILSIIILQNSLI